tara:strand:+ start:867 stop:968 length:102 start_codon:yes stop_codon:yes gene_type:complete
MTDKKNNRGVGRTALLLGLLAVGLWALTIALNS